MGALLALVLALPAAAGQRNDPDTLFQRAELAFSGKGVPQDCPRAVALYEKSAEGGHGRAAARIGGLFFLGKSCVKKDLGKAKSWFEKGAAAGDADALINLGFMHNHAMGAKKDYKRAMELYLRAAEKGHPQAMENIGYMYRNGQGVKPDAVKAAEWDKKAQDALKAQGQPTSRLE